MESDGAVIMAAYLLRRIFWMVPTFFGITLVTFFIMKLAPGNPILLKLHEAENVKSQQALMQSYEQLEELYGLNVRLSQPSKDWVHTSSYILLGWGGDSFALKFERMVNWVGDNSLQYGQWLKRVLNRDFGRSFKDDHLVIEKIKEALPITLALNLIEVLCVYLIAVPLGVWTALRQNSLADRLVMTKLFLLYSIPTFWMATLLMSLFGSADHLNWFPLVGYVSDGANDWPWYQWLGNVAWHLVLPVTCMVLGSFAFLSRFVRSNFLEVIQQDYIRTARAKGLSRSQVIWRHAFRNSLIPLVTLLGTLLPSLMGGSVIIEQIFSIPGMGKLAFEAVHARDYPTVMGIASFEGLLTLISLLLSDLLYVWVDPRISYEKLD